MLVLGLESSCDETAAAIVEGDGLVRSSVVATQHDLHAEYGGVVPEIASRAHVERIQPVVREAIAQAGITPRDLDAVAVANQPGLVGSLLVGVAAAKALAWSLGVPLVGVNHVHAHLDAVRLRHDETVDHADVFPALGLVVSGGHTAIYRVASRTQFERVGSTIDDAMGEAFDKVAQILRLPHPGGPEVDRLASEPDADPGRFRLPVPRLPKRPLDFSFSGLKTAVLYTVRGTPRPAKEGGGFPRELTDVSDIDRRDLAASFQRTAVKAVMLKLGRALDERVPEARALIAGGGVTANSHLRSELARFAHEHDLELKLPKPEFCIDNAAMIASLGADVLESQGADGISLTPTPTTAR
ncbi:MAG: tRNA (adenosine(37)-N6)-threonylcarbamoyltransferase complex transferase subunit TsaD [Planctomycetota bacterium]